MSPSPKRDYPSAVQLIPLRSTPYPLRDTSSVTLDNLSPALEPNARLTRYQAYQQGTVLPPISSYLTYTNTLPLISLLSAAFEPTERHNYWKSEQMMFLPPFSMVTLKRIPTLFILLVSMIVVCESYTGPKKPRQERLKNS